MSREDWEIFDQLREERREKRRQQLAASQGRLLDVHTECHKLGLWMRISAVTHWQFGRSGSSKCRLSYWPSSRKMQLHPGTRVSQQIDIDRLLVELRRLAQR